MLSSNVKASTSGKSPTRRTNNRHRKQAKTRMDKQNIVQDHQSGRSSEDDKS